MKDYLFFEDERMFSSGYLLCREGQAILDEHLFRLGQVDGRTPEGTPFISSTNPEYIADYVKHHTHQRWAPQSYIVTSAQAQITISNMSLEKKASITWKNLWVLTTITCLFIISIK